MKAGLPDNVEGILDIWNMVVLVAGDKSRFIPGFDPQIYYFQAGFTEPGKDILIDFIDTTGYPPQDRIRKTSFFQQPAKGIEPFTLRPVFHSDIVIFEDEDPDILPVKEFFHLPYNIFRGPRPPFRAGSAAIKFLDAAKTAVEEAPAAGNQGYYPNVPHRSNR